MAFLDYPPERSTGIFQNRTCNARAFFPGKVYLYWRRCEGCHRETGSARKRLKRHYARAVDDFIVRMRDHELARLEARNDLGMALAAAPDLDSLDSGAAVQDDEHGGSVAGVEHRTVRHLERCRCAPDNEPGFHSGAVPERRPLCSR